MNNVKNQLRHIHGGSRNFVVVRVAQVGGEGAGRGVLRPPRGVDERRGRPIRLPGLQWRGKGQLGLFVRVKTLLGARGWKHPYAGLLSLAHLKSKKQKKVKEP